MPSVVAWAIGFSAAFMCLSVCLFVCFSLFSHDISKPDVARITELYISTMSLGNPFILGSKGQDHEAHKTLPAWVMALV